MATTAMKYLAAIAALALGVQASAQTVYTIATNPQGSIYYSAGAAVAKVGNDKLNLQMRVQPFAGSSTYLPMLNRGEVDFSFNNVDDVEIGFRGVETFAGKPNPNIRLVGVIFPLPFAFMVAADAPWKKAEELKGLRIPSEFTSQTTVQKLTEAALASAGLSYADMKGVPVANSFQGTDLVPQGRADVAGTAPGVANIQKAHIDMSSHGGVRFIGINDSPAGVQRMKKVFNSYPMPMEPAKHLPGIVGPTQVMGYSAFLVTHDKQPVELVYKLTKTIHASRDELIAVAPQLARFDAKKMAERNPVPYHPGAVKYYTEQGQWPPKQ